MSLPVRISAPAIFVALTMTNTAMAKDSVERDEARKSEPLQIVVSIADQRLAVFQGGQTIAESKISSGKPGHSTPSGIFSILHKRKRHFSNLYDNAPMPFMQRLTWTGIALHGSDSVPSYPASHGCIRLPGGFDKQLYGLTNVGAHVVINSEMVTPSRVTHSLLPQPVAPRQYDAALDHWQLRLQMGSALPANVGASEIGTAKMLAPVRHQIHYEPEEADPSPLRILITRRTQREIVRDIQRLLNKSGYEAGIEDGIAGRGTRSAIKRFQDESGLPETGAISSELIDALYRRAGESKPPTGKLLVRRDFEPLFQAGISIDNPTQPLGTHLLTTTGYDRLDGKTSWNSVTLENRLTDYTRALYGIDPEADDNVALRKTLDRIDIPEDLRERLDAMLTPGSSIAIADNGTHRYTGWKTDFVVTTKIDRSKRTAGKAKLRGENRVATNTRPRVRRTAAASRVRTLPGLWFSH